MQTPMTAETIASLTLHGIVQMAQGGWFYAYLDDDDMADPTPTRYNVGPFTTCADAMLAAALNPESVAARTLAAKAAAATLTF